MDALSRLVRLARLRGSVDLRCLVAGRYTLDNPDAGKGQAPFHLLLSGACVLELPGRRIEVAAGDLVLLPRGVAHRMHARGPRAATDVERRDAGPYALVTDATSAAAAHGGDQQERGGPDAPVDLFCGHYTWEAGPGQVLMDMLPDVVHVSLANGTNADADTDGGAGHRGAAHLGRLAPLSGLMRDEAVRAAPGAEAVLDALCDVLLTLALRGTPGLGRTLWLASAQDVVRTVTEAVLRDPAHDWRIEEFAGLTAMSRATFIRHFVRETGMNPGDFLTRLRMLLAADMLTRTDHSVAAVADAVGYASESAFGRAFRVTTGETPARLRRAARALR
ncbi:AraC family transcriptional regulator [Streptomyces shenzhenensis]|uniref:AraC family transcriptional regulator n=1 Tax=Streptomyces shenzhenensis TaxID=943815 RepID=UPI001F1D30F8|nr:AraC family transcriptional regulator [Streptomyces shenzhenensis]